MADQQQQAVLSVLLNGEQAKTELTDLQKKAKDLALEIDNANKAGNKTFAAQLTKDLKETNKQIKVLKRETIDVSKILNNLSAAKPRELSQALSILQKRLNSGAVKRGSSEWNYLQKSIQNVRLEMRKIQAESQAAESSLSRFSNGFNKYFGVVTSFIAAITGLSFAFRKLAEDVAKMDDIYADVMKTTGLTREEVVDLNDEFKKMNTRTSREQLNLLARDAGKLGITGKKDILDFVEAANQIEVALGEDLGDGAIRDIGKITEVFRKSSDELDQMDLKGRMLAVGSVINELGQSSTAQEGYLVNFTKRLGGVASQANITVQQIMGYGSALDQSGQAVEMSATAVQKFIMKLMSEPAKFAKIAGLEVKSFTDLLKKDTNQAIITVLDALSKKGGFQQLIPIFKDMGLDGARAVGVLSAMATNIDLITEAQEIANTAFSEATSLTTEYNVKNENLMARLDKARKKFKDQALELGSQLNPALLHSVNGVTMLIKVLSELPKTYEQNKAKILLITAAFAVYTVGVNASVIADKLKVLWTRTMEKAIMSLYRTIVKHPYGALAVALAAVIGYLIDFNRKTKESVTWYKNMLSLYDEEKRRSDQLFTSLKKTTSGTVERKKAIDKINEVYGKYTGYLLDEKATLKDIYDYQNLVNQALLKNSAIRAQKEQLDKTGRETTETVQEEFNKIINKVTRNNKRANTSQVALDLQQVISEYIDNPNFSQSASSFYSNYRSVGYEANQILSDLIKIKNAAARNQNEINQINRFFNSYIKNLKGNVVSDDPSTIIAGDGDGDTGPSDLGDLSDEKATEQKKRINDALKKLETEHLKEITRIKQEYLDGYYKSEHEYNHALLEQQSDYDNKRKEELIKALKTVTDPSLRVDLAKQIADIEEDNINRQIKQSERIKKILLDADPITAEKQAYEERLRETGLFGKKKEDLTREQLEALELLEKQHEDNLRKLSSKDALLKLKELETEEEKAIAFLEERRVRDKMSDQQYKDELLSLELAFLNEKLQINGLSAQKIEEINKEIIRKMGEGDAERNRLRESLIDEYDLKSDKDKYQEALATLQYYEEQGILTHEEAIKAKSLLDRQYFDALTKKASEYLNIIASISGDLSSSISGFQEAEEMAVERKYNKLVASAGKNNKKIAKLEEEKEKEIAAVKAKHADKQFTTTVAQVVATTAVTAMEAYKAMAGIPAVGPALGVAAAGAALAYGASQIAVAKEQKEAAKAAYWSGGFTPRGPWDRPQGIVHSEEFIGNRFAVRNPAVRKVFSIVDQAQKNNTVSSLTEQDFTRALDYREAESENFISGISSAISPDLDGNPNNDGAFEFLFEILSRHAEVTERLNKRLDEPFETVNTVTGKNGIKQAQDRYDKITANKSRS